MTGHATELAGTRGEALALLHGGVVFQQIFVASVCSDLEDGESIAEPVSGAKVPECFTGLQDAGIPILVALHADVLGQPGWQTSRIYDRGTRLLFDVRRARAMAVFTSNCQFRKRRPAKESAALWHGLRPSAVTDNAGSLDRPIEPVVVLFITWREIPCARP